MDLSIFPILPVALLLFCALGLAVGLLLAARIINPARPGAVKRMPYESGVDPIHDARRRFDVRFFLLAIAFLVFDVELLFLYPWAVYRGNYECGMMNEELPADVYPTRSADLHQSSIIIHHSSFRLPPANRHAVFAGAMVFLALLVLGFVYDWRKGVFRWR